MTAALRSDDVAFFRSLSSRASDFLAPADVRQFWNIIRQSLPKFRQRKLSMHPVKIEALEDQWMPYFEKLELGSTMAPEDLVSICHSTQAAHGSAYNSFQLADLPTLYDLEREFRATTPHRATGMDALPSQFFHEAAAPLATLWFPLLLKQFLWQHEPLQAKGGQMTLIPKAGGPLASGYRGIMLLSTYGKRVHAIIRKRLLDYVLPLKPAGQLGGFPKQQSVFGAHVLQTFGRMTARAGLSSGVVFVDLSNAFHRLLSWPAVVA